MSNPNAPWTLHNLQAYGDNTNSPTNQPTPSAAQPTRIPASLPTKTVKVPCLLKRLDPAEQLKYFNDDPVFKTPDAGAILGVTPDRLEKWRRRGQGPEYLRYDGGDIFYELSALIAYKAAHRIHPSRQPKPGRRS